ncbi:MAG: hypothetical protein QM611_10265 [Microbacterium sp.]|uniref:hypothetical protein n=1 Tax=Microbacterium sp. TaxID=51671 RepID=UPI0039E382EB
MTRTSEMIVEVCPVCASLDVRALEPGWFALDLARETELRDVASVEFACRDCGSTWH